MTPSGSSDSRVHDVLMSRPERVDRASRLLREAVEWLSEQVNDEQIIGGALSGLSEAEANARLALSQLSGLATSDDVRGPRA